ncbi:hypothetical protein F511_11494 [Dorcoceras hygrometricum]|uniref:BAH domain-containing protein n=1 Tax=Dorcoceras hygrometricum TaxID=472368 RepID=A0A2Z7D3V5_9LAMI|nr:hypothetical protein F511_11494 [Dorcoceras hygrometricum]
MSEEQVMRAWEECLVSEEKGNRIVHYNIRDTTGYHLLAVVGTDGGNKHMIYTVARDFIRVFGSTSEVHDGKKWRTRRDVVEWLASLVSKRAPILADSKHQLLLDITPLQYLMSVMTRFSTRRSPSHSDEEIQGSSATVEENSDIVWLGDFWKCCKQLTHYPAFCRRGTKIPVYSFVWVMDQGDKDHIGYVEDMYEDPKGEKMVKVRWLNFQEQISFRIPDLDDNGREVFLTRIEQEISAECIDGLAAVLTPNHFKKCLELLPQGMSLRINFCHREIINKSVKPFSLSKLRGYSTQPILCTLETVASRQKRNSKKSTQDLKVSAPEEAGMHDSKSNRTGSANQTIGRRTSLVMDNQGKKCETSSQKVNLSKLIDNNLIVSEPLVPVPPKVEKNIELLCQDSGMRGCWFRCKILRSTKKCLKVQYLDVDDADGTGKLEECVPVARVADPDKLGIRCAGRLTVRPWPSEDTSDTKLEVGMSVDARWHDGWWEGIVLGCDPSAPTNLQVYLPGESKFLTFVRNNLRVSRDWIDNTWVNVKPKADILSFLTSTLNPVLELPPLPDFSKADTSAKAKKNECSSQKVEGPETDKRQYPNCSPSVDLISKKLHYKKRLMNRASEGNSGTISGNEGKSVPNIGCQSNL